MDRIPSKVQKYFWDVDVQRLEPKKDAFFIISRLLEYGDLIAIRWLFLTYSSQEVAEILKTQKNFSFRSAQFWQQYFNLKKTDLVCFQKSSRTMPVDLWPPSAKAAS